MGSVSTVNSIMNLILRKTAATSLHYEFARQKDREKNNRIRLLYRPKKNKY